MAAHVASGIGERGMRTKRFKAGQQFSRRFRARAFHIDALSSLRYRAAVMPPTEPRVGALPAVAARRLPRALGVLLTTTALLLASRPIAAADTSTLGDVNAIIAAYSRNPNRNRGALLALARRTDVDLPPVVALMAGDAALRAGAPHTAVRRFERVIATGIQEPWLGWTRLALGWIALTREDLPEARAQFDQATGSAANTGAAARLALALLDASESVGGAAGQFAAVANDRGADPMLRAAATLGGAYARYWAGGYEDARGAFLAIAEQSPASPLADDARYAAAWMAVHTGARTDALEELTTLAGSSVTAGRRESTRRDLLNLEPRALMQVGVHRYRRGPIASPDQQLAKLLDGDGVRLARAALRWVDELENDGAAPRDPLTRPWAVRPIVDAPAERVLPSAPTYTAPSEAPKRNAPSRAVPGGWRVTLGIVAVVLAVIAAIMRRSEGKRRRP